MRKIIAFTVTSCLVFLYAYIGLFGFVYNEEYFPLAPDIDTKYAENFDEKCFDEIKAGMSKDQVVDLIGSPLWTRKEHITKNRMEQGITEIWWYTQDNACWWADVAWIGREIYLNKNGEVIEKIKSIHRD